MRLALSAKRPFERRGTENLRGISERHAPCNAEFACGRGAKALQLALVVESKREVSGVLRAGQEFMSSGREGSRICATSSGSGIVCVSIGRPLRSGGIALQLQKGNKKIHTCTRKTQQAVVL